MTHAAVGQIDALKAIGGAPECNQAAESFDPHLAEMRSLDVAAKQHAAKHGCSYIQALHALGLS